ncbi:Glutamate-rich protein 6 Protein FAM194A [Channa argus]|uniref:Glutamate-rich protein 6 Protein FAM194A n=1 Tax=Channa argus TaxID=215402 RepID=A0A6G1QAH5_CHAAH|nr:Glutamate-rich protein 6 Protein FAM194A [Channa argus]
MMDSFSNATAATLEAQPLCVLDDHVRQIIDTDPTAPLFCCTQWQQLCEMLVEQRCLLEGKNDLRNETSTSQENKPASDMGDLIIRDRGMEEYNKFVLDLPSGLGYPSGLLAVVVATEENGKVCIVYDDSNTHNRPMRAVFQSDGRATCYHGNGNIWLSLNKSGGQCLDEVGARVRRWCWSSMKLTPTPLHPVFLSLNKTIGVRVLGKEQVFVSFLASGQQAKFSVGTSSVQGESKTDGPEAGPSVLKEELLLLAARIRIHLAIQDLHQYLKTPYHPRVPKATNPSPPGCYQKAS